MGDQMKMHERVMQERRESEQNKTVAQKTYDEVGSEKRWRLINRVMVGDNSETIERRDENR